MFLGIDEFTLLIFEGSSTMHGRGLLPQPVITAAAIRAANLIEPAEGLPQRGRLLAAENLIIFREDSFDPVTRIRRGRFYKKQNKQRWLASNRPVLGTPEELYTQEMKILGPMALGELITFPSFSLLNLGKDIRVHNATIELGSSESPTLWTVIYIETISTGEELVTLKAQGTLGALPELNPNKIQDSEDRTKIVQTIEKLADTIHRAGPESVIDRGRDAASAVLLVALRQKGQTIKGMDLSKAIDVFEKHPELKELGNVISSARIIARLHSRAKPSEQERRESIPTILEQDADLAVLCVGTILRDLGWANWL